MLGEGHFKTREDAAGQNDHTGLDGVTLGIISFLLII